MATNIYVRSTTGNNGNSGATWALAKATLAGAAAIAAAGDTVWVSQVHAESTAGSITLTFTGTAASPIRVVCGNDGAEPPTALATTATVATTGATNIVLAGVSVYWYGISFTAGTTNGSVQCANTASAWHTYEKCSFIIGNNNTAPRIFAANVVSSRADWINCSVKFGNASQGISNGGFWHWNGGSVLAGGTTPTSLINDITTFTGRKAIIENVDLSNFGTTFNFISASNPGYTLILRSNILPASWTGLLQATTNLGSRVEMYNTANTFVNYKVKIDDYTGTINDDTTIYKTGGLTDGTTPFSLKMVTTANSGYPNMVLRTPEVDIGNLATGSSVNVDIDIIRDSATNLKDNEVWLELIYLGTSGISQGTFITDMVNVVTTAADQASSSATWNGTGGMTNPNKQKVGVTFVPQVVGPYAMRVAVAKASTTLYADMRPVIT